MEKKAENNENKITLKDFINWVVVILTALISTKFFGSFKDNELVKFFFISLTTSLFATFIWIKIFSNKKDDKLVNRLLKEVETKKDLERQKEKLEESLKMKQMLLSHSEKNKEELAQENKKLGNERNQLSIVLAWYGVLKGELGIDGNVSFHEWEKNPEIKKKKEQITKKMHEERWELEGEISSLSFQLEKECGVSKDSQHVSDKRRKKWAIDDVELHWKYIRANKNEKIKGKTIEQFLGSHWKEDSFQNKEEEEIAQEKHRLIQRIDEFANSAK